MLKEKGILKFKYENNHGSIHYIKYNNEFVALTKLKSGKITYINKNNKLDFLNDSNDLFSLKIEIDSSNSYTQEVYDYMLNEKFTHFKSGGHEGLVVLKLI